MKLLPPFIFILNNEVFSLMSEQPVASGNTRFFQLVVSKGIKDLKPPTASVYEVQNTSKKI